MHYEKKKVEKKEKRYQVSVSLTLLFPSSKQTTSR